MPDGIRRRSARRLTELFRRLGDAALIGATSGGPAPPVTVLDVLKPPDQITG
jgi:hypothetical protein